MTRGRKPKPTAQKKLEGNGGKRKLNTQEPQFAPIKGFEPPEWLNEIAALEWCRVAPQLAAQHMLADVDKSQLEAYCVAYSRWRKAESLVEQQIAMSEKPRPAGSVLELPLGMEFKAPSGYPQQIPQIGTANTYLAQMRALASEFGFTPAARARLHVEPAHKRNEADAFFDHPAEGGRVPDAALQ